MRLQYLCLCHWLLFEFQFICLPSITGLAQVTDTFEFHIANVPSNHILTEMWSAVVADSLSLSLSLFSFVVSPIFVVFLWFWNEKGATFETHLFQQKKHENINKKQRHSHGKNRLIWWHRDKSLRMKASDMENGASSSPPPLQDTKMKHLLCRHKQTQTHTFGHPYILLVCTRCTRDFGKSGPSSSFWANLL